MSAVWRVLAMFLLPLLCCLSADMVVADALEIRVGAYDFPPYAVKPEHQARGVLPDLLALLNAGQSRYRFVLVPTSNVRRYRDFAQGRFDLMFFEAAAWGWGGIEADALDLGIEDAEVFVARATPGRDQAYFDRLSDKRLALRNGYHYGFAGLDADPARLAERFQATLTYSHESNLLMVLHGRVDVAVVTRSYLQLYLEHNPELADAFLVSRRTDQTYRLQALLRPRSPLSKEGLAALWRQLLADNRLASLLESYHLPLSPLPPERR
ncbi:transporter substrate-binding domain-containing protein [Pseudomonas sp. RIT-PI-AD]|uniref:transporter substrate-binding domain-containing protein n=1 Tax=Pseudomonas sp. RIT-PI-AD TaxID=3035294 RepID=UPI0021DA2B51|nr:transporter substrate-binding domain-containing protein [Pseudomonas sp. RIT-PI-AD]